MLKNKIFAMAVIIVVLIIAACSLDDGVSGNSVTNDSHIEDQDTTLFRGTCTGLPATKTVRYVSSAVTTISGSTSVFNQLLIGITNGSRSYYYQETCYKGTIRSVDFYMVTSPVYNSGIITCTVRIIYSGTVNLIYDPCMDLPASKSVTITPSTIVTISGSSDVFNQLLMGITSGSRSYYYQETCYKGTLRSIDFYMVTSPVYNSGIITCTVRIKYSGTVYKK